MNIFPLTINITRRGAFTTMLAALALALVLFAGGCGVGKFTEPFRDAPVQGQDTSASLEVTQPDGFSNFAVKCISAGYAVATTYHGDEAYAAISGFADVHCKGSGSRP